MTEQASAGGDNSELGGEFAAVHSPLIDSLNAFDEQRHGLYDFLAEAVVLKSEPGEIGETVAEKTTHTMLALSHYLGVALQEESLNLDDVKQDLVKLWVQDDNERNQMFFDLFDGCQDFTGLNEESTREMVDKMFAAVDTVGALQTSFESAYGRLISDDLKIYIEHLERLHNGSEADAEPAPADDETAEPWRWTPETRAQLIGRHALDVAKIAVGVSLALWLTRRRRD